MKSLGIILFAVVILTLPKNLAGQEQIKGTWLAEALDNSLIMIYKDEGNYYSGKIIASDEAAFIDQIVLKRLKYNKKKDTWEGKIYSPRRQMEIDGKLSLESADKLKVVGSLYLLSRTFYWTKVD